MSQITLVENTIADLLERRTKIAVAANFGFHGVNVAKLTDLDFSTKVSEIVHPAKLDKVIKTLLQGSGIFNPVEVENFMDRLQDDPTLQDLQNELKYFCRGLIMTVLDIHEESFENVVIPRECYQDNI